MALKEFNGQRQIKTAGQAVTELTHMLGFKLTAFIARVENTETIRRWMTGELRPPADALRRIEFTRDIAKAIAEVEGNAMAQTVMMGQDPALGGISMLRVIRHADDLDAIKPAVTYARDCYLSGGVHYLRPERPAGDAPSI